MGRSQRQLASVYDAITSDIFKFCEAMNFQPTWQQAQLLEAVQRAQNKTGPNRIGCKSGQGPGKTTVSAIIGLWRSLQDVDALTVVTAPTLRQCKDVWLVEARKRVEKATPFLRRIIKVTKTKVEIGGRSDWGVKLVTATKEENAQGYHDPNMSVIAEEASGIPRELITQFKGTLSNPNSLFLMIGNPNTRDCAFFDCFNSDKGKWKTLTFNAEDTARDYPWIVSPQRNKDLEEEFGRESDVYRIRVLGEFPHSDPNSVMREEDVRACTASDLLYKMVLMPRDQRYGGGIAKQFGMDFARFGGDESTIARRSGMALVRLEQFVHHEPSHVIDRAFVMQKDSLWKDEDCWYVADAGGMGQGVMHRFYEAEKNVVEFHSQARSVDQDYADRITEAYFHLARLVKKTGCYLPDNNILIQQLSTRWYFTNRKGKLVLESKDDYMKRGHDSPDRADGAVYAMYDEVQACGYCSSRGEAGQFVGESVKRALVNKTILN